VVELDSTTQYMAVLREPLWKLARVRRALKGMAFHLGGAAIMVAQVAREARNKWEIDEIIRQMDALGVQSISITNLTALFTGMVLALQTAYALAQFGGKYFVGRIVVLSICRELGPTLTALMVAARVGAGIRPSSARCPSRSRWTPSVPSAPLPSASSSCRAWWP